MRSASRMSGFLIAPEWDYPPDISGGVEPAADRFDQETWGEQQRICSSVMGNGAIDRSLDCRAISSVFCSDSPRKIPIRHRRDTNGSSDTHLRFVGPDSVLIPCRKSPVSPPLLRVWRPKGVADLDPSGTSGVGEMALIGFATIVIDSPRTSNRNRPGSPSLAPVRSNSHPQGRRPSACVHNRQPRARTREFALPHNAGNVGIPARHRHRTVRLGHVQKMAMIDHTGDINQLDRNPS